MPLQMPYNSQRRTRETPKGREVEVTFSNPMGCFEVEAFDPRTRMRSIGMLPILHFRNADTAWVPSEDEVAAAEKDALEKIDKFIDEYYWNLTQRSTNGS